MKRMFWKELLWLLVYVAIGLLLTLGVMMGVGAAHVAHDVNWPGWLVMDAQSFWLHVVQWSQTLLMMALPPLLWARFYLKEPAREVLNLYRPRWQWMVWVTVLMVVSLPLMDWLTVVCQQLPLPDFLSEVASLQQQGQIVMLRQMLAPSGALGWLELILLMAVGTAIGEELLFRGALLRVLRGSFIVRSLRSDSQQRRNRHVAALMVGLLFSLIHFDIYGLLPRWLLGTFFVYLVYWTGSIWPAVLAHALNNLFALVEFKISPASAPALDDWLVPIYGSAPEEASEALLGGNVWLVAASAIVTALLLFRACKDVSCR